MCLAFDRCDKPYLRRRCQYPQCGSWHRMHMHLSAENIGKHAKESESIRSLYGVLECIFVTFESDRTHACHTTERTHSHASRQSRHSRVFNTIASAFTRIRAHARRRPFVCMQITRMLTS